jgi:L-lactate dehydrogenase complex protein LldG
MSPVTPMIKKISRALGRQEPLHLPPNPPAPNEAVTRLLKQDADLPETFAKIAAAAQFKVDRTSDQEIAGRLLAFLQTRGCRRIGLTISPLLQRLDLAAKIKSAGYDVRSWNELTLDEAYDLDCGITDVYAAVAETGSLVIRPDPDHGRALSLVPPTHIAIVEASNFVADLIDLFEKLNKETTPPNITIITGPSKTADIEGVLVTGVHGPGLVQVFVLA